MRSQEYLKTKIIRSRAVAATGVTLSSAAAATAAFAQAASQQVAANDQYASETVTITARHTALDTLPELILDTPQSINVIPSEIIKQQGVSNLQDALKNVPGITLNAGEGGTHGDLVNLRGFSAGDDFFLDGLRDTGLYTRDSFDYDSVEVYKGPASTLFGRGSTGGVINQVTKSPMLKAIDDASATIGSNDEYRGTADINYAFSDTAAFRLNLMDQTSKVADRDFVKGGRWGIAPSIAEGLGTDTAVTLKYLHQYESNIPDYGVPFVFGKPAPVNRNTYYGLPADDRFISDVDVVTGRVDHTFNDVFSISDTARYGNYYFDSRQTAAIYGSANCFTNSASPYYYAGGPFCSATAKPAPVAKFNPLFPVAGTPLSAVYVERDRPSSFGTIDTLMNNADLTAKFSTGALSHTLVAGLELDREDADLTRFANQNTAIAPVPLLAPVPSEAFPGRQTTVRQLPDTKTDTVGAYINDTVSIGDRWDITGAVRLDHFHAVFDQTVGTAQHFEHTDVVASPRAAVVYKPTKDYSVYVSYGTSYNPSAENLSLAASNKDLGPEKDRTYEAGAKAQVLDGTAAITTAVFDTEMTNARITDPLNPSLQSLAGTLHVKGFEANLAGYLTQQWEITAGYTYLDPSSVGLVAAGVKGPVPNTAHNQANLWTTYDIDDAFTIGTGLNYLGVRAAGTDNMTVPGKVITATVPSYVTWDGLLEYKFNEHFELQFNVTNIADAKYYANSYFTRPGENHVVPGAGRTMLLTLNASL